MRDLLSRYRNDFGALAFLFLLGTLAFADVLFGFRSLYVRDLTRYYYPTKKIIREVILSGEIPYWNRYYSAGQPMAANPEYEIFYPPQWLVLLPDYDLGYRLHILVHVYISLVAMYALLRSMRLRVASSTFGALVFGLGGLSLSLINLLPIYFCAVWIPLILLFARRFLRAPNATDFSLTSLFLGVQMLVGEPTTLLQTWTLLGIYGLYRAWYSPERWKNAVKNTAAIAAMGSTAVLVGGVQLIAAIDHAKDSVRVRGFDFGLVSTWSMPFARPIELVFPTFFGYLFRDGSHYWASGLYKNTGSPFYFSIYLGLLTIVLALAAVAVRPRGGRIVFAICAVSYLIALGGHTPLLKFLYDNGLAGSIRYYEKFSLMALVVLIIFAAKMADRCLDGDARLIRTAQWITAVVAVVALGFFAFSFFDSYAVLFRKLWGQGNTDAARRMVAFSQVDWGIAVARAVMVIAVLEFVRRRRMTFAVGLVAGLLLAIDLHTIASTTLPRLPRRFFTPPPIVEQFDRDRDAYRVFHEADWYGQSKVAKSYFSTGDAIYWIVRNGLFPMTPASWGFSTVLERDYDKTALLPTVDLVDAMWKIRDRGQKRWAEIMMSMSNAWYRGNYVTLDEARKEAKGNLKNANPVKFAQERRPPRYYFATRLVAIKGVDDFVTKIVRNDWTEGTAYVTGGTFQPARGLVTGWKETANTARIEVQAQGRAFLLMSVTPHKYWRATIDGRPARLRVANIGYQGLEVPPGRHVIEMRYRNPIVATLAPIALVSFFGLLAIAHISHRRRGRAAVVSRGFVATVVVVLAGAAITWIAMARAMAPGEDEGTYIPKEVSLSPEIELLRDYVRIDTSNPPGKEREGAEFLASYLRRHGIEPELIEAAPGRTNLYARIRGERPGHGLMLMNHIDVVPAPAEGWQQPPFSGSTEQNVIWGRGVLDMKGIAIAQLLAFVDVAMSPQKPAHDLVFLAVADEERGSRLGTEWLITNRPDVFEGVRYVFNEGGITEVVRDRITYFAIEIGSKQFVELLVRASTRDELERVRRRLLPYFEPTKPDRVLPAVREYFRAIAPHRHEHAALLRDIDHAIARGKYWLLSDAYRALLTNYLTMGAIRNDGRSFVANLTLANLPDESPEQRISWLRQHLLDSDVTLEVVTSMGPAPVSSTEAPVFEQIVRAVKHSYGENVPVGPHLMPYGTTDCRYLRKSGIDCYGFWPFPVDFFRSKGIHGRNEALRLDWYLEGLTMMRRIVDAYSFDSSMRGRAGS